MGFIFNKNISNLLTSGGKAPFTEKDVLSGVFQKSRLIESTKYSVGLSLNVVPRDADEKPIVLDKIDPKEEEAYKRDFQTYQNISKILNVIERQRRDNKPLPKDLNEIVELGKKSYPVANIKSTDQNGKSYAYTLSSDKKHVTLVVSFESQAMIDSINVNYLSQNKRYKIYTKKYSSMSIDPRLMIIPNVPEIKGKQVTFDETSGLAPLYLYTDKYPDSQLKSLVDLTKQMPDKFDSSIKSTGTYQKGSSGSIADFESSLDLKLAYSMINFGAGLDIKKIGPIYFGRLRDMPNADMIGGYKVLLDKWIKFDTTDKTLDKNSGLVSQYAETLKQINASSSANSNFNYTKFSEGVGVLLSLAEKNNLFVLRNPISKDKLDDLSVYRYDLKIDKTQIPAFLEVLSDMTNEYSMAIYSMMLNLNNDSTSFVEDNVFLTLWIDSSGIIQKGQLKIRIVPPQDQANLKDKQVEFLIDASLKDVNDKINISIPDKFITPTEADKILYDNQPPENKAKKADVIVTSAIMQMRTLAETKYNSSYSATLSYNGLSAVHGAGIKPIGDAKKILDKVQSEGSLIYAITDKDLKSYAFYGKLQTSGKYICVDSTGATEYETNNKTSLTCSK